MNTNKIEEVIEWLKRGDSFLIASHKNPEADTLGSQLALKLAIERNGGKTYCLNISGVPEILRFLPGSDHINKNLPDLEEYEKIIVLDSSSPQRISEEFEQFIKGKKILNIDHHSTNTFFGEINYVDSSASATVVLIYRLLKEYYPEFDIDVANNLYAGLIDDTGSFAFSNTNEEAFCVAEDLVKRGVNTSEIYRKMFRNYPFRKLKLLGYALQTLEFYPDKKASFITVTKKMFEKSAAKPEDTENFVDYARDIEGVEVAFLIKEIDKNKYKLSIRSNTERIDASYIASLFGGGGHKQAAGAEVEGKYEEIKDKLINTLMETIEEENKIVMK